MPLRSLPQFPGETPTCLLTIGGPGTSGQPALGHGMLIQSWLESVASSRFFQQVLNVSIAVVFLALYFPRA